MKRGYLFVFLSALCVGCITIPFPNANIRRDQIQFPQVETVLMLQICGEGIGYFHRFQASVYSEVQYLHSLTSGQFSVPPSSESYINIYPSFRAAVVTGAKLAFKNVIMEEKQKRRKAVFSPSDYKLRATLRNAGMRPQIIRETARCSDKPDIVIGYYAELLDNADSVITARESEVKGYSPGGACNKAGLEIINWVKTEIGKLPVKKSGKE